MEGNRNRNDATRAKILVVDDAYVNRVVMRRLLASVDAELIEAASGKEALTAAQHHEFALILLDVNMPEMDGFELAAVFRENEKMRAVPIMFVTAALGDDMNRLKGYQFGAVDYITKPVNDVVLRSKVQIFLELYAAKAALNAANRQLSDRNRQLEIEISERKQAEESARHQAKHDPLTGLPNRILFIERIEHALERARRDQEAFALAYIDIDGFKQINDAHGHQLGDELLKAIATRLRSHVRSSDTVSRLGGDEFAVILGSAIESSTVALRLGVQIWDVLKQPYSLPLSSRALSIEVGASVGIALYPEHGREIYPLIHAADSAMYRVKNTGRNHCLLAASA